MVPQALLGAIWDGHMTFRQTRKQLTNVTMSLYYWQKLVNVKPGIPTINVARKYMNNVCHFVIGVHLIFKTTHAWLVIFSWLVYINFVTFSYIITSYQIEVCSYRKYTHIYAFDLCSSWSTHTQLISLNTLYLTSKGKKRKTSVKTTPADSIDRIRNRPVIWSKYPHNRPCRKAVKKH